MTEKPPGVGEREHTPEEIQARRQEHEAKLAGLDEFLKGFQGGGKITLIKQVRAFLGVQGFNLAKCDVEVDPEETEVTVTVHSWAGDIIKKSRVGSAAE